MANRSQRRALAKPAHKGRVTPKKDKVPKAWVTITDEEGNSKKVEVHPERVSAEEIEAQQAVIAQSKRAAAEQEAARARAVAHAHGLWLPGDPLPGQG